MLGSSPPTIAVHTFGLTITINELCDRGAQQQQLELMYVHVYYCGTCTCRRYCKLADPTLIHEEVEVSESELGYVAAF